MKLLKIILIVFLVLIFLVAAALFIFIKTFDMNRYKPDIIVIAQKTLGRDVEIGSLGLTLSVKNGIQIKVSDAAVADNHDFSADKFLSVKEVFIGVDPFAYLTKREIHVSTVKVVAPRITIIRNKAGVLNAQTVAQAKPSGTQPSVVSPQSVQPLPIPSLVVENISITNAGIRYIDQTFESPLDVTVQGELILQQFSLSGDFTFKLVAACFSDLPSVRIEGKARVDAKNLALAIKNTTVDVSLDAVNLEKIKKEAPFLNPEMFPLAVAGNLKVTIVQADIGKAGLTSLDADMVFSHGCVKLAQPAVAIENISKKIKITQSEIDVEGVTMNIGQGTVNARGIIRDYLSLPKYSFTADIKDLDIGPLVSQKAQAVKVEGAFSETVQIEGEGFDYPALLAKVRGKTQGELKDGRLKDMNVLKTVLDKISVVPDLAQKLEENLPAQYREKLTQKDTEFKKMLFDGTIADSLFHINSATVDADIFLVKLSGDVGFDQSCDVKGTFFITGDLAQSMVSAVKELEYLMNQEGQIAIPVIASGKGKDIKVLPDVGNIAQQAFKNKGAEELGKVLDKFLGSSDKNKTPLQSEQSQDSNATASSQDGRASSSQVIQGILDSILK